MIRLATPKLPEHHHVCADSLRTFSSCCSSSCCFLLFFFFPFYFSSILLLFFFFPFFAFSHSRSLLLSFTSPALNLTASMRLSTLYILRSIHCSSSIFHGVAGQTPEVRQANLFVPFD
jgi:hypothetical protein